MSPLLQSNVAIDSSKLSWVSGGQTLTVADTVVTYDQGQSTTTLTVEPAPTSSGTYSCSYDEVGATDGTVTLTVIG